MKLLLSLALLLVALGAAFFLWSDADHAIALESESGATHEAAAARTELAALSQTDARESVETKRVFGEADSRLSRAEIEALPNELVLAGRVLITELDGSETRVASGRVHFTTWVGEHANSYVAQVRDGYWKLRFELAEDGTYLAPDGGSVSAALRAARLTIPEVFAYDAFGELGPPKTAGHFQFGNTNVALRPRRLHSLTLRVEDSNTGAALERVSILKGDRFNQLSVLDLHNLWVQPSSPKDLETLAASSPERVLVAKVDSPIRLTEEQRKTSSNRGEFVIGSPGYAWTNVELDLASDGERIVTLEPGGELEVSFEAALSTQSLRLRIGTLNPPRFLTRHPLHELDPVQIKGLRAGTYELQVESEGGSNTALVWARAEIEVAPGSRKQLTLRWDGAPEANLPSLSGTLTLPSEWGLNDFVFSLRHLTAQGPSESLQLSLSQDELQKVGPETYEFHFPRLAAGKYELELYRLKWGVILDLPATGLSEVHIDVPPPADLKLFLIDDDTGTTAEVTAIQWSCENPGKRTWPPELFVPTGMQAGIWKENGEDFFRLRVPRTEIRLTAVNGGSLTGRSRFESEIVDYMLPKESFSVSQGGDITIRMRRAVTATLTLLDGKTRVPWPRGSYSRSKQLGGDGELAVNSNGARADRPGRYLIEIPRVPGFEPHAPVEIELGPASSEKQEILIRLVRQP